MRAVNVRLLSSRTRDANVSRLPLLFMLEFEISDRFFFSYLGQGILTFIDRISYLFWSSVCPMVCSHTWDKDINSFFILDFELTQCLYFCYLCIKNIYVV